MLRRWESLAGLCMAFLRQAVRFVMVTIPEALALRQLDDVFRELAHYELKVEHLRQVAAVLGPGLHDR